MGLPAQVRQPENISFPNLSKEMRKNINDFIGIVFLDIDECETSLCHFNASCNNTVGSYICTCNSGYDGDGLSCSG